MPAAQPALAPDTSPMRPTSAIHRSVASAGLCAALALARAQAATPPPYAQCAGTPMATPGPVAATGLAKDVLDEWERQFVAMHGLSASQFEERVHVTTVERTDGPMYVWVRIEYTFALDWVRARQVVSVNLGEYPLARAPSRSEISRRVRMELRERDQLALPEVAPQARVEAALRACDARMRADWCGIRFENGTGRLLLVGHATVDERANQCMRAAVDVATGGIAQCAPEPCRVSGMR